jgi:Fe-S-cluster containining protein
MDPVIKNIRKLALKNDAEIEAFCEKLQTNGFKGKSLDPRMKRLLREKIEHFDCTKCAACCKEAYVVVGTEDIARLAKALGMKRSDFRARYVTRNEDGDVCFNRRPCPFLKKDLCTQYEARPDCCREYPHSLGVEVMDKLDNVAANYEVCPAVYEAVEELRSLLFKPR